MLKRGWNWASVCPPGPTAALLGSRGEGVPDPHPSPGASGRSRHSGENEGPYRLKSRISLLRAGVDMLPSSPAVSLKEKSPAQPPHPPARRPNHCGSPPPLPRLHKQPCNDVSLRRLQIHFLYQYSLQFFLDIYHNVLYENPNLKGVTDHTQRLSTITKDLFQVQRGLGAWPGGALGAGQGGAFSRAGAVVTARCLPCLQVAFNRVARGMLHQDHITFAMLLARIKLKGTVG